jgi:cation diffusion facilitator CzcD-associated flavoprotein CzcO
MATPAVDNAHAPIACPATSLAAKDGGSTVAMATLVNPPLTYSPVDCDIPPSYVYGDESPKPEVLVTNDLLSIAKQWVMSFNDVLDKINQNPSQENLDLLDTLVVTHASWKDHLATTWDYHQFHGLQNIKMALKDQQLKFKLKNLKVNTKADHRYENGVSIQTIHPAKDNLPPVEWLQVVFDFENEFGVGQGLLRLITVDSPDVPCGLKAYCIYTALENIKGNEEQMARLRPEGVNHGQHSGRTSWKERREEDFKWGGDKQPTVLIVGGGQGGLNTAARLKVMGINSLIIEKNKRIGDNWRNRYKFLVLHDPVWYDHLSYINFPDTWPIFTPKDKLGDWFDHYAKSMELSYWNDKTVTGAKFDDSTGTWTVSIKDNETGETTYLNPKHVVMSTGHSGEPNVPQFKDQEKFKGKIVHSSQHTTGKAFEGQNAIVIGCCNSGHDIAQDFYEQGAKATIVQRSSTCIINSELGLKVTTRGLYEEGGPKVEVADMILQSLPITLLNLLMQQQYRETCEIEKDIHDSVTKAGFKMDAGYGGTGLFGKYFRRGGGYYIDVGASKLIADNKISIKQGTQIERFTENGVVFEDGSVIDNLAIVVLATGYSNMKETARRIFGDEVADRLNPVWGLDEEGEFKTMWRHSGHPNFWYMGGNLAMSRYYSKRLALKIVAQERGFA